MKKIAVFGSTGSIGVQALDVIRHNEGLCADVLVAHGNIDLLIRQALVFKPRAVGLLDENAYDKEKFSVLRDCEIAVGNEACSLCLSSDEIVFSAVGCDVLPSLMEFVRHGKTIALANKECLVSAGRQIMTQAETCGAQIVPVDSEHSAVWQCLRAGREVEEIILTASGGRYYDCSSAELKNIRPEDAVRHPNWKMGRKISVDSATMINKALEIIEAYHLFGTEKISYIIHPESIIHSMVRFKDGAIMAQMSEPDMRLPISVALAFPERVPCGIKNFEFDRPLTFKKPREEVFFAPTLAYEAIKRGGCAGAILDAADEAAVKLYLSGKITFDKIAEIVRDELLCAKIEELSFDGIVELHKEVVQKVLKNNL